MRSDVKIDKEKIHHLGLEVGCRIVCRYQSQPHNRSYSYTRRRKSKKTPIDTYDKPDYYKLTELFRHDVKSNPVVVEFIDENNVESSESIFLIHGSYVRNGQICNPRYLQHAKELYRQHSQKIETPIQQFALLGLTQEEQAKINLQFVLDKEAKRINKQYVPTEHVGNQIVCRYRSKSERGRPDTHLLVELFSDDIRGNPALIKFVDEDRQRSDEFVFLIHASKINSHNQMDDAAYEKNAIDLQRLIPSGTKEQQIECELIGLDRAGRLDIDSKPKQKEAALKRLILLPQSIIKNITAKEEEDLLGGDFTIISSLKKSNHPNVKIAKEIKATKEKKAEHKNARPKSGIIPNKTSKNHAPTVSKPVTPKPQSDQIDHSGDFKNFINLAEFENSLDDYKERQGCFRVRQTQTIKDLKNLLDRVKMHGEDKVSKSEIVSILQQRDNRFKNGNCISNYFRSGSQRGKTVAFFHKSSSPDDAIGLSNTEQVIARIRDHFQDKKQDEKIPAQTEIRSTDVPKADPIPIQAPKQTQATLPLITPPLSASSRVRPVMPIRKVSQPLPISPPSLSKSLKQPTSLPSSPVSPNTLPPKNMSPLSTLFEMPKREDSRRKALQDVSRENSPHLTYQTNPTEVPPIPEITTVSAL